MDAHRPGFQRRDATELIGVEFASGCPDAHRHWKASGSDHSHCRTVLQIGGDDQWQTRSLLQSIQLGGSGQRRTDRDGDSANGEFVDPFSGIVKRIALGRNVVAPQPWHDQLSDLFTDGRRFQNRVNG